MQVRVWDGFIRGFHWLLLATFLGLWFTGGKIEHIDRHEQLGLFMLALLLTRIIWGFVGSESARFQHFLAGPKTVIHYLKAPREFQRFTHNPLGAWSVVALLVVLLAQVGTGLFTDDAIFYRGPLAHLARSDTLRLLTSYHKQIINFIWVLVILHVVAIVMYRLLGKNLVPAMIHGNQAGEGNQRPPVIRHGGWGYLLLAVNCIWIFYFLG